MPTVYHPKQKPLTKAHFDATAPGLFSSSNEFRNSCKKILGPCADEKEIFLYFNPQLWCECFEGFESI